MNERIYPYLGWVLTPSFKPKQVTLITKYGYGQTDYGDLTEAHKLYALDEIFPTKEEAITYGHERVKKQQAALDKTQAAIHKRRASLEKASLS